MTNSYQKILVTGSSAVLGTAVRAIAPDCPEQEFIFLTSKDCDLTDPAATLAVVERHRPDAILHLAAVSGGIGMGKKHPAKMLRDNVLMTFSVLDAARKAKVKKTVMTLSVGMYPVDAPLPLNEEHIHDGAAHPSNYAYSYSKRLIDPAFGARPLKRAIQRLVLDELATKVLAGELPNGSSVEADFDPDQPAKLAFTVKT